MKRVLVLLSALVLLLMPLQTGFAAEVEPQSKSDYLVKFNGPAEKGLLQAFGVEDQDIKHNFDKLPIVALSLSEDQAKGLSNHPQIETVEEDAEVQAFAQSTPWGVPHVQGTDAQNNGHTGEGVKVAVLDSGVDSSHEDLNVAGGHSVFDDSPYNDGNGHGTHVAGTIAALDNDVGVVGVAPDAEVYAVKVLDANGSGSYSGIAEGIEWAINNDMDVINMSLGGSQSSTILEDFANLAYDEGVLVVAAAGNEGNRGGKNDTVGYPAKYDSVMAVAAVDENNQRATFSSTGPAVEISAPGVNVLSSVPGNNYDSYNGTSMASPHVAGVAAQVWAEKPGLSNVELRNLLNDTAQPLGDSGQYGSGLVQSLDAINQ